MFRLLQTDFYQLSMAFAYTLLGRANMQVGFEAFTRKINTNIEPSGNFYIFDGEFKIRNFIEDIREEIHHSLFPFVFAGLIRDKIAKDKREEFIAEFINKYDSLDKDFQFNVINNGSKIFPYVPVFQYKGPIWIGQLLETMICNLVNGRIAYETFSIYGDKYSQSMFREHMMVLKEGDVGDRRFVEYRDALKRRAGEYRLATDKTLLEAAFRRAPSFEIARLASQIALDVGWDGTSNVSIAFHEKGGVDYGADLMKIGGTMAHSFVMSYRSEEKAFKDWNSIFPRSTILIDTYDCLEAAKTLTRLNIVPKEVRIDSDPLIENVLDVKEHFDKEFKDFAKVGFFLSGDMTPESIRELEKKNVPFTKIMAGTKYVHLDPLELLNAGLVYKLVQVEDEYGIFYPEKKAKGKKNYPGLKKVTIKGGKIIVQYGKGVGNDFKLANINNVRDVEFERLAT